MSAFERLRNWNHFAENEAGLKALERRIWFQALQCLTFSSQVELTLKTVATSTSDFFQCPTFLSVATLKKVGHCI